MCCIHTLVAPIPTILFSVPNLLLWWLGQGASAIRAQPLDCSTAPLNGPRFGVSQFKGTWTLAGPQNVLISSQPVDSHLVTDAVEWAHLTNLSLLLS